ncbi:hypothetical protein VOLCADRAFT_88678 [Volvox carteri f. nagariensis]|uniref:Uncharacterized protein n=1 Tax=Volvox carteri f. nagariensis TaxID=3068 RepID=D8TPN3_VOLCA|nr:uncharacterized protein VOLCADRAFT_88678 [Volvox carteri f. nagariensis]EFJ50795.1 hypothetical protein VOLCADRAFT_88678 [Volvox carteri f. nagariensis]|eukprot:XP_002948388.1 hypothetical protein VOLCADRAFT_88678 [Volvox carteri f. nagariensis]
MDYDIQQRYMPFCTRRCRRGLGFYPYGTPNATLSTPFTPSGMLLKAVLIVGARALQGANSKPQNAPGGPSVPNGNQGWGHLNMAGSLPLAGFTDPRVHLQLLDRGEFSFPGQAVAASGIVATGTGPISIVLTYYDYPADSNAGQALVNDLDLFVYVDDWEYIGNNDENAANPVVDSVNTVERVLLTSPPAGASLHIVVVASNLPSLIFDSTTPQRWAVAVVGHFTGNLQSELNPFWAKWQGRPTSSPTSAAITISVPGPAASTTSFTTLTHATFPATAHPAHQNQHPQGSDKVEPAAALVDAAPLCRSAAEGSVKVLSPSSR